MPDSKKCRWRYVVNDNLALNVGDCEVELDVWGDPQLGLSPAVAVELATRLLELANELDPGIGGFTWPPTG